MRRMVACAAAAARTAPPPRRRFATKPPVKATKADRKKLTREEVEALAAAAKATQKLVDTESRLFGGGVGPTHPFVLTLLAACVGLHFYNADRQTKREEEEELLERLRARRRARPLQPDEIEHAIARKQRLLARGDGDAADAARLSEEIRRLEAERAG